LLPQGRKNDTLLLIRDQMAVSHLAADAMKTTNE
jgi:hypothetical protein